MRCLYQTELYAVKAGKDAHIVWDCGAFDVKAGEWLVSIEGTLDTMTDDEIGRLVSFHEPPGPEEKRLQEALDTGYA